jgi:hypothetical protein
MSLVLTGITGHVWLSRKMLRKLVIYDVRSSSTESY